jgi:type I restriction enzyme R subunit
MRSQELPKLIIIVTVRFSSNTLWLTPRFAIKQPLRVTIKQLLKKYGYPPDKQEKATSTVLEQASKFFFLLL